MLDVDIAAKTYRRADGRILRAIDGIRFTVAEGRFACVLGPSGCGKTTMLRILLGLEKDFTGRFSLPGGRDARIGAVFQEPRLLPWRTVDENVRLAMPAASRRRPLDALYRRLGLEGLENFYPGELSLGLARRAALARAFAVEPSLLVLDEPFVSLDEPTAADLRRLLLEVWSARSRTALMVTHNLREAVELADTIFVLSTRPGRTLGEYEVPVERGRRDPATVSAIMEEIGHAFPGLGTAPPPPPAPLA